MNDTFTDSYGANEASKPDAYITPLNISKSVSRSAGKARPYLIRRNSLSAVLSLFSDKLIKVQFESEISLGRSSERDLDVWHVPLSLIRL